MDFYSIRRVTVDWNTDVIVEAEWVRQGHETALLADIMPQGYVIPIQALQGRVLNAQNDDVFLRQGYLHPAKNAEGRILAVQSFQVGRRSEPVVVGEGQGVQPGAHGGV